MFAQSEQAAPPLVGAMSDTLAALVENIVAIDRMAASLAAAKAEMIDQARQWSEVTGVVSAPAPSTGWSPAVIARRELTSELAVALRIPERTAETLVAESQALLHELPATFAALSSGSITRGHASVVFDHAASLPVEARSAFELAVLPHAQTLTVAKLNRAARVIRERIHPKTIEERHTKAADDRFVEIQPAADGMAWLSAFLPAPVAYGIYHRVTDLAIAQQGPDEARTLAQLRADSLVELLMNSRLTSGRHSGIRAHVNITVPALTLLGHSDEPAVLDGYGPIDLETAKELAGTATSFVRLLTHPETGAVLSVGRTRYSVPADLRAWLQIRDGTCRFPGCSRAARNCDVDHTHEWESGGATDYDNLAHLCPAHHHLKHQTGWTVRQVGDGALEWTSPAGRVYVTEPETVLGRASEAVSA